MRYGWRASFFVFGFVGVLLASTWYFWFRDSPAEKRSGGTAMQTNAVIPRHEQQKFPWRIALQSQSIRALLVTAFCYVYVFNFFQTWFHTFLVEGRAFSEAGLLLSAIPYAVAACANLSGGLASDVLVRRIGPKNGRRVLGVAALAVAGAFTTAAMMTRQQLLTVILLALVYGAITFQQSVAFGVCLDVGHKNAGAVVGLMNTSAQVGWLVGAVAFGYIVERFHNYDAPLVPMAALLFVGALSWLKIDASDELKAEAAKVAVRA